VFGRDEEVPLPSPEPLLEPDQITRKRHDLSVAIPCQRQGKPPVWVARATIP
jgi:hypothetical protein